MRTIRAAATEANVLLRGGGANDDFELVLVGQAKRRVTAGRSVMPVMVMPSGPRIRSRSSSSELIPARSP
jgi:hypothetical protein